MKRLGLARQPGDPLGRVAAGAGWEPVPLFLTEMAPTGAPLPLERPDGILLLSDGEANSEDAAILAEVRYLRGKLSKRVRIDTVGFYLKAGSRPELLLKQIARENGGDYAAWDPRQQALPVR